MICRALRACRIVRASLARDVTKHVSRWETATNSLAGSTSGQPALMAPSPLQRADSTSRILPAAASLQEAWSQGGWIDQGGRPHSHKPGMLVPGRESKALADSACERRTGSLHGPSLRGRTSSAPCSFHWVTTSSLFTWATSDHIQAVFLQLINVFSVSSPPMCS